MVTDLAAPRRSFGEATLCCRFGFGSSGRIRTYNPSVNRWAVQR